MRKSRWFDPYESRRRTNLSNLKKRTGVYLVRDNAGTIRYIGYSGSDLYKTITRHFQEWNDRSQIRVTYPQNKGYQVRVILCTSKQAPVLEERLRDRLKPTDNPQPLPADWEVDYYGKQVWDSYSQADNLPLSDIALPF